MRDTDHDSDERDSDELHGGLREGATPDGPAAPGRRSGSTLLTAERLRIAWPDLSRSMHRYLRSRGASSHDAEDIAQAVALKVLAETRPIRNLTAWALTAARNMHVDLQRKASRDGAVGNGPPPSPDPADVACSRDECERSLAAIAAWQEEDRRVLVQAVNRIRLAEDRRAATRRHVRVHRLRRRLHSEVDGPLAGLIAAFAAIIPRRRGVGLAALPLAIMTPMLMLPSLAKPGGGEPSKPVQTPSAAIRPPSVTSEVLRLQSTLSTPPTNRTSRVKRVTDKQRAPLLTDPSLPRHARVVHETPAGPVGVETYPSDRRGDEIFCAKDVLPGVPEQCIRAPR